MILRHANHYFHAHTWKTDGPPLAYLAVRYKECETNYRDAQDHDEIEECNSDTLLGGGHGDLYNEQLIEAYPHLRWRYLCRR